AIPSNDDASKSIDLILSHISEAISSGLGERKKEKEEAEVIKEKEESEADLSKKTDKKEDISPEDAKPAEKKKRVRKKITNKE
ncbi:MAG: 30S ribosomal protein S2, partial [Flavobacteriaceae bacterium]|nr:30S ribosomal protein S2 [Flavobacteriaceae bacterium]